MTILGMGKVCLELLMRLDNWDRITISPNLPWVDVQEIGPARDGKVIRCIASNNFRGTIHYINLFRPDVVVVYGPIGWISAWIEERNKHAMNMHPCKEIFYITVEGSPLPYDFVERFKTFNPQLVLTPSQWSADVLKNGGIDAEVLLHGVDHKFYSPTGDVRMEKTKFRVGSIARNDMRKGLVHLINAFYHLDDIPEEDIELFFPCPPLSDHGLGSNLRGWACGHERVKRQVAFCPLAAIGVYFPEELMPARYRTFDIHAFVSGGESFGLPVLEAAACKIPQLLSNHDVFKEIVGQGGAYYVRVEHDVYTQYGILKFPDPERIARGIRKLYFNERLRTKLAERAYENSKHLTWENATIKLEEYLE